MVSIVIPAYNEQDYLPRLLRSIQVQDFQDLEIIVADADSTDRTAAIARSAGARVTKGGVPAVGRNRGARLAKGEYLLFIDADAVMPSGFMTALMDRFEEDFLDICAPSLRPIDGDRPVYGAIFGFLNGIYKFLEFLKPQASGACILTTRRLHRRIDGFDESRCRSEDLDYINRAAKLGRYRFYRDLFVYFSVRRFEREGIAKLIRKYLRAGFIYFFSSKQDRKLEYDYGVFGRHGSAL